MIKNIYDIKRIHYHCKVFEVFVKREIKKINVSKIFKINKRKRELSQYMNTWF